MNQQVYYGTFESFFWGGGGNKLYDMFRVSQSMTHRLPLIFPKRKVCGMFVYQAQLLAYTGMHCFNSKQIPAVSTAEATQKPPLGSRHASELSTDDGISTVRNIS